MATVVDDNIVQKLGLASYEMSVSISLAQRAFKELLKTCLGHYGLTVPQWTLLGQLFVNGPARPTDMSKILGIQRPAIAILITELETKKLITALVVPDDGRSKVMTLTHVGKELVKDVEIKLESCLNEQLKDVDQADLQTYFMLTQYIAQNMHHHA